MSLAVSRMSTHLRRHLFSNCLDSLRNFLDGKIKNVPVSITSLHQIKSKTVLSV